MYDDQAELAAEFEALLGTADLRDYERVEIEQSWSDACTAFQDAVGGDDDEAAENALEYMEELISELREAQ